MSETNHRPSFIDGPLPVDEGSTASGDEAVARLIRLAGHRPPVPDEDHAIVRAAARAQWQWTVASERRRSRVVRGATGLLAMAAAVLLFVATGLWDRLRRSVVPPVAVVAQSTAAVPRVGAYWAGDPVETTAGRLALLFEKNDESVRLDTETRLSLKSSSVLELQQGAVYIDSQNPGSRLEVHTELGIVRHIGTQFEVRLEPDGSEMQMRVRVREGKVEVEDLGGQTWTLGKDDGLTVTAAAAKPETISCHGSHWDWVVSSRPPLGVEEPTIRRVLEWAAREKCWTPSYALDIDPSLLDLEIQGSEVDGGSLEDAVRLALAATGRAMADPFEQDGVMRVELVDP